MAERTRMPPPAIFETDVPARLDRLPWARFHWLVVTALGVTWILDGLEVTLVGSLSGAIVKTKGMHIGAAEIGAAASFYLVGAVCGALFFGWLTDRLGRKRLFSVTLLVYLIATILTGFAWNFWSFALFRLGTGAGIGGEYAAVNSAIQELIPARYRGHTDLTINGSFWIGAALGALGAITALDPNIIPAEIGWRVAFVIGGALALIVLVLRRFLPESPRWLMTHGRGPEAEEIVGKIEARVAADLGVLPAITHPPIRLIVHHGGWFAETVHQLVHRYRRRTVLGLVLMASQAFCYNAIFFTYALILTKFYKIPANGVGWFLLPFAAGNFLGPLLLGRLFDTLGRRPMIAGTYVLSGVLMVITGWLFRVGALGAVDQTVAWTIIFFFASAAASSAYLTVGEYFPLEMRAIAIGIFYAIGTGIGGVGAPALFGVLIAGGNRGDIFGGYVLGAALMVIAGLFTIWLGVAAERRPLEEVALPLSAAERVE
ncbi:MAG: MFS transporter [Acetobacteraceae bacterium]